MLPCDVKEEVSTVEIKLENLKIRKSSQDFLEFREKKLEEVKENFSLEKLKDNPIIRSYRDFYWRIDIDPTKIRPSSEALIRRVLQGRKLPLINNLVDAYNLASILTLISMGAYDLRKIKGKLRIRYSNNEEFRGIGGKSYISNAEIVIADEEKIVCIFPYRDSDITKITEETKEAIIVLCGVKGIEHSYLRSAAEQTLEIVERFCDCNGYLL